MEGLVSMFTVAEVLNFPEIEPETTAWEGGDLQHVVALYGPFKSEEDVNGYIDQLRGYGVSNHFRIIKMLSAE